ncbi:cytochrome P450 [Pseudanabaena sp. PCC 6802]|uniref:cytochrome P450 n=1 Tax=Pseudanabaena sp. PCC 6802 TaxID=118173 RepID=UPI000344E273|nr:cytochrome P450 [Pseudanabaena sp. PCC 6802]
MLAEHQTTAFDLLAPASLANPYPLYKQMRETDPVYYSEANGFWVLTRYSDVEDALRDDRLSADRSSLFASQLGGLDLGIIQNFLKLTGNFMIEKDPPEHTRMRKIANQGFTARALESWRSIIQDTTDRLLDRVQDRHQMDIVADLSVPLPALIIADIFGVPEKDRGNLIEWAVDIGTFWGAPATDNIGAVARKADRSAVLFTELMQEIIAERQHNLGTDMISLLISAYTENGMNLEQIPSLCILILNAGHLTTTDLIPNGVNALLSHPEQLQKLKDNPALLNSAIEEMIRFDTPAPFLFRIAKETLTVGGKKIPAGSVVALGLGAANHDPAKFQSPEIFDITRSPNEHIGFGQGVHFCLGAVLARMELSICFSTLFRRMPNLHFDRDLSAVIKHTSLVFKGFETLAVKF